MSLFLMDNHDAQQVHRRQLRNELLSWRRWQPRCMTGAAVALGCRLRLSTRWWRSWLLLCGRSR